MAIASKKMTLLERNFEQGPKHSWFSIFLCHVAAFSSTTFKKIEISSGRPTRQIEVVRDWCGNLPRSTPGPLRGLHDVFVYLRVARARANRSSIRPQLRGALPTSLTVRQRGFEFSDCLEVRVNRFLLSPWVAIEPYG